jgi:hypothetical protein
MAASKVCSMMNISHGAQPKPSQTLVYGRILPFTQVLRGRNGTVEWGPAPVLAREKGLVP